MGRVKQPLEQAQLKGADKVNPARYKNAMPAPDIPIGKPPAYMSDEAQECWHDIVKRSPRGILTGCDVYMIEIAANMLAEYRRDPDKMQNTRIGTMRKTLIGLGFSPTARRDLGAETPKANPFAPLPK